jgi:hypothetical protein
VRHLLCILRQQANWIKLEPQELVVHEDGMRVRYQQDVCTTCGRTHTTIIDTQTLEEQLSAAVDDVLRRVFVRGDT